MIGERANTIARASENDATRGLVGTYSTINSGLPVRTPRAPAQEDHIANEIRNIRALTETQSSLLGGDNTPLYEGTGSTGFDGVVPRKHQVETPNPMATPFRQGINGVATPLRVPGPGATPMRTPRDNFAINADGDMQLVGATPHDIKLRDMAMKHQLKQGLASLPKPKDTEWELELPEEQQELMGTEELSEEDAELRDRRNREIREAQELLESKRRTQVLQRGLPRPAIVDLNKLLEGVSEMSDPTESAIAQEMALLIANDSVKYPTSNMKIKGAAKSLEAFEDDSLARARLAIAMEMSKETGESGDELFEKVWNEVHPSPLLPGLTGYASDENDEQELMTKSFDVCDILLHQPDTITLSNTCYRESKIPS